jgi:hypothetical protein
MCGQSLNFFLKIWIITTETLYIYYFYFLKIFFYTFKVATTKFSWKFTMFQESFYMFKTLKKGGKVVFLYRKSFSLIKCSPNHFYFLQTLIFPQKGSMCSKHSKNKNTYTFLDFNIRMSFYTITVWIYNHGSK